MAKTFLQLRESIKSESRLSAGDDLDAFIGDVINQEYRNLCENAQFPQLLVPFAALTITSNAQSVYTLPVGLRQIVAVEFSLDSTQDVWRPLTLKNGFMLNLSAGNPSWYFRAGNNLHVFPYSTLTTANALRITYYKNPTALVADGDVMEVEELEGTVIKKAIARVLRYHKDSAGEAFNNDSMIQENKVIN